MTKQYSLTAGDQDIFKPARGSIARERPDIASEWHPTKNGDLTPDHVPTMSKLVVWWMCPKGHEWKTAIKYRSIGHGCPYCSGRMAIRGVNDLQTINPRLAKEWHPTKNGDLRPDQVTAKSNKRVWWICSKGHEWVVAVGNRNKGNNCPYCSNHRVLKGYNDLASLNPDLAKEWHPTKNGDLKPSDVLASSHKDAWWLCPKCGYEWETDIKARTNGRGCPFCKRKCTFTNVTQNE